MTKKGNTMKNLFSNIVVAAVCLSSGYLLYPVLNENNEELELVNELNTNNEQQLSQTKTDTPQLVAQSDKKVVETKNNPVITNIEKDDKVLVAEKDINVPEPAQNDEVVNDSRIVLQQELKEWTMEHKERIDELITANMSSSVSEGMKAQVIKDNDFLTKPELKQDSTEDENWSYNMEQEINRIIAEQALGDKFELLNISCKQLTCDILGVEKEGNTWFKLYVNILKNAPMAEFPNGENAPKSLVYMDNGKSLIYSQIRFKSS